MREILFRGKVSDDYYREDLRGRWVEGNLVHQTKYYDDLVDHYHIVYIGEFDYDYYDSDTVISETIGQYTGLIDKNGVKIFEGDIVKGLFKYCDPVNSVIEFREGSFGLKWYRGEVEMFWAFPTICHVEYEVIGNIHDNPDLLKG